MWYKIQFTTSALMWDFIDAHIGGNYTADNQAASVELREQKHPKEITLKLAKEYGGTLK